MPELRVLENDQEMTYPLSGHPVVVGRGEGADVALAEPRASRRHCVLEPCGPGIRIRDLDSANGTRVNGERVLQKVLRHGDEVAIGEVRLRFQDDPPPPVRPAPRRSHPRGAAFLIVPAVLLGLALLALAVLSGQRDDEIAAAREAIARAALDDALAFSEPDRRVTALETFLESYPDSRAAGRAREEVAALRERRQRDSRSEEAFRAVESQAPDLAPEELAFRYEGLLKRYGDVPGYADRVKLRLRRLAMTRRVETTAALAGVREEASQALATGDYGAANRALGEFGQRHADMEPDLREQLARETGRVLAQTQLACRALEIRSDALRGEGKLDEAENVLVASLDRFASTRFAADLQMKTDAIRALRAAREAGDCPTARAAAAAAGATSRERRKAFLDAREAEDLARGGLYDRAIEAYGRILEGLGDPRLREELAGRVDDLVRVRDLLARIHATARGEPGKFKAIRVGETRGRVLGADENEISIEARGATIRKPWSELETADLVSLARALPLDSRDLLALAVLQYDRGDHAGWIATLIEAMQDAALEETIESVFARKEGVSRPAGGFVAYHGRILTRETYDRERREEEIAALLQRFSDDLGKLDQQPAFKAVAKMREKRASLEAARKHALELIFDEQRYFYPYQDRMAEYTPVQKEVDERVSAVREIWDDPTRLVLRQTPEAKKLLERLEATRTKLVEDYAYDADPLRRAIATRSLYLPEEPLAVTIHDFPVDVGDAQRIAYDRRVMDYNEKLGGVADASEADQVRITNEYRIMMGRAALVRDDRLVMSARKHCEDMAKNGYFGHFSPVPELRDPMMRMRLEGYPGMPVSENCHRGASGPEGAHAGWCHSSGHHRNLLGTPWTEMGTGRAGNLWTQNFGRTKPLPESGIREETPPPR